VISSEITQRSLLPVRFPRGEAHTKKAPLTRRDAFLVALVGAHWNSIVLELREWLRFGEDMEKDALAKEMTLAA
jgi:hypothetical protein